MRFELQRADFWKRISAFLFDIIIFGILLMGVATAMSAILDYDKYLDIVEQVEMEYVEKYGINPDITDEEFAALTDEEKEVHFDRYVDKYVSDWGYDRDYVAKNLADLVYDSMLYDKTTEYLIVNNDFE